MAADPTLVAIPFYFGSMEVERRYLRTRAELHGPSAADYTPEDTRASLTMGVASLLVPLATRALARRIVPGKGRAGKALVATAVSAAVATTVADRVGADRVRRITGPVAVGTGTLAAAAWTSDRTSPKRMWQKGQRHDRGTGPLPWLAALVGWDFVYYWNHRFMHEVRWLWADHVVHHSSERYNLSTALRQPVADVLGIWVPYGLMARFGIRPSLIEQARGWNLLYQYWIHTDAIRSLGAGESVLNTPSHHRVHHGSNPEYIDRNHGSILIIWDRLFGTFQREEEPVVYGLTKNINTYDPVRIADHEFVDIFRDIAASTTWRDRLSFAFRGPGWAYRRHAERACSPGNTLPTLAQR